MIYDRLRVLISFKLEELAPERRAVKRALDSLSIDAWVVEEDAAARPTSEPLTWTSSKRRTCTLLSSGEDMVTIRSTNSSMRAKQKGLLGL